MTRSPWIADCQYNYRPGRILSRFMRNISATAFLREASTSRPAAWWIFHAARIGSRHEVDVPLHCNAIAIGSNALTPPVRFALRINYEGLFGSHIFGSNEFVSARLRCRFIETGACV
jgi:hypothetical protein